MGGQFFTIVLSLKIFWENIRPNKVFLGIIGRDRDLYGGKNILFPKGWNPYFLWESWVYQRAHGNQDLPPVFRDPPGGGRTFSQEAPIIGAPQGCKTLVKRGRRYWGLERGDTNNHGGV